MRATSTCIRRRRRSGGSAIILLWAVLAGAVVLFAGPVRCPAAGADASAFADSSLRQRELALQPLRAEHRSAKKAIFMTLPVPGWGQLYADSPFWSLVTYGVQMFYLGNILMERRRVERERVARDRAVPGSAERDARDLYVQEHRERARDYVWWSSGALFLIALDAYVSIQLADFDHPGVPTPDLDKDWDPGGAVGDHVALRLDFSF